MRAPLIASIVFALTSAFGCTASVDDDGFDPDPDDGMMDVLPEPEVSTCVDMRSCLRTDDACEDIGWDTEWCSDPANEGKMSPVDCTTLVARTEACVEICADRHPDLPSEDKALAEESWRACFVEVGMDEECDALNAECIEA